MTVEEYRKYSDLTIRLFNYMNGRINQMNSNCILEIDPYDLVYNTYGNIKYPNRIFIHVGTVIDGWDDAWSSCISKHDYIGCCLAWAISHELHHADQLISMIQYNINQEYKKIVEADVERASYNWVVDHASEISSIGGFNVVMDILQSPILPAISHYRKASTKEFYLQTIANIVIKDFDLFEGLKVFTIDSLCDDMILVFNNIHTIVIKSNGNFLAENVVPFSRIVYHYCGQYNIYNIYVDVSFAVNNTGRRIATVEFNISNQKANPLTIKDESLV